MHCVATEIGRGTVPSREATNSNICPTYLILRTSPYKKIEQKILSIKRQKVLSIPQVLSRKYFAFQTRKMCSKSRVYHNFIIFKFAKDNLSLHSLIYPCKRLSKRSRSGTLGSLIEDFLVLRNVSEEIGTLERTDR